MRILRMPLCPFLAALCLTPAVFAKEVKGGPPVIALEAAPWDFELPRGFSVNRLLSKDFQPHQRPALIGDAHLRKHREDYERHKQSFPQETVEPFDNSAYSITVDLLRGVALEECVEGYLEKWSFDGKARVTKSKVKLHGTAAFRAHAASPGAVTDGLFVGLEGGGCLSFTTTPALESERAVWSDNARGLEHIAKTLLPRGTAPKKPRAKPVPWPKVPARHMFDGLESRGGKLKGFRSAF